ncbi:MAG: reprolysin-like metallopeptidase [Flavobacterium sp.]
MKNFLLLLVFIISVLPALAQEGLWIKQNRERVKGLALAERASMPVKYDIYSLNLPTLKNMLLQAPPRETQVLSGVVVEFPKGDGTIERFRIYEASVMHPDLADRYPEINSYVGQGVDDPASSIRFSITPFGLHTMIFSPEGTSYTDAYTKDLSYYISYAKRDLPRARHFACGLAEQANNAVRLAEEEMPFAVDANDGTLRRYRLALACTIEYSAYHINAAGVGGGTLAQKKAAVLAAMNVTMTRVNFIYERDLAVTMQIIANNSSLIFVDSDNLTNDDGGELIDEIQPVINSIVGSGAYDIGHVFSTGGGGIAALGSVCSSFKAQGVTGLNQPVGDAYDIDFVAHEMGHQFGGNHTFNANTGSCQGNRNSSTAVEPGSGTTIMAYAGICGSADVQNNSDAYFHATSLNEMFNFITGTATCGQQTTNGNTPPVAGALSNYTIPKSTPFVLRGSATDADGDAVTYCWEQTNAGGGAATMPSATATNGPVFRSLSPTASPNRYFPSLPTILGGSTSTAWEVLPSIGRTLSFALTVRDNRTPNGGQTDRKNMNVTVNGTAGPFAVTSQDAAGISWTQGSSQTITWNVAGTTAAPVSTANVNILLSTDGGITYPTVLAANTPNDGSQTITAPNLAAPYCRVMVEAAGNIYFAVNSQSFSIGGTLVNVCNTYTSTPAVAIPDGATGYSQSAVIVPAGGLISDVNVGVNLTHTAVGNLRLQIQSPTGTTVQLWQQQCGNNDNMNLTFDDSGFDVLCSSLSGPRKPASPLSGLTGQSSDGAWQLRYGDFIAGNTGILNSWSVNICSQQFLATDAVTGLSGFVLYPNPSNGSFTIDFTSSTGSDIAVSVHDLRGRQVYGRTFANTGVFSANVNLDGVQSGVYLVTVEDGGRREVRKIVVQ